MKGKSGSGTPTVGDMGLVLTLLAHLGAQDKLPFPFIMHKMDLGCQEYTKDLITYQQAPIIPITGGKNHCLIL